jgi:hypothetical protein
MQLDSNKKNHSLRVNTHTVQIISWPDRGAKHAPCQAIFGARLTRRSLHMHTKVSHKFGDVAAVLL